MKAYVDVGAFNGKILRQVLSGARYGPEYKAFAFECNPYLFYYDYGKDVTTYHFAAWIEKCEREFYINTTHPTIQGNSFYKEKRTGNLNKNKPLKVKCIDFSLWLKETFKPDDYVVCKMNIEGAEYDVLEKCVADGTIDLIDELHIQWHYMKIPNCTERHKRLILDLNKVGSLQLFNGYGYLRAK